ncbi:MAG: hypothetical protein LBH43_20120 [Treponema sp.]|jgi:hypothetical protein|nr:hypothetical protein [Treponema sp.]
MTDFIEQRIIDAVRKLLTGRVNEKLNDYNFYWAKPIRFNTPRLAAAVISSIL